MTQSPSARVRLRRWLDRWQGILPLLVAELVVWLGFGSLLPVLPLYFRDHGVDLATMGLVIAAWPAARLVAEPFFGWLADRTARVPLMVVGLVATGLFVLLPVWFATPLAFLVLRALAGLASAIYDPAARGFVVDATPRERRGEAFGLYGAAQMGGLLIGPAVGALVAGALGGVEALFILCAVATWISAAMVWLFVRETAVPGRVTPPAVGVAGLPTDEAILSGRSLDRETDERGAVPGTPAIDDDGPARPTRLWNRLLVAAVILQVGSFYASGTYEVVWSLYLEDQGAGLDLIGLTFAMFGLPILLLSPFAGRVIDRSGVFLPIIGGSVVAAVCGVLYIVAPSPIWFVPIVFAEGAGFAFLSPALFSVVAAGSPPGRSSTAQGILGAAGTIGTIIAAMTAGAIAGIDLRLPFLVFSVVMTVALILALLVGGRTMARLRPARPRHAAGVDDEPWRASLEPAGAGEALAERP
jgi:DHA1 family multidrug resistance protein-like MFS transporter